jgi:hypothetical protein
VVENYAPLSALRPAPGGRELAWYAPDDRAPGRAMWGLWCGHVLRKVRERLGSTAPVRTTEARVVRQAGESLPNGPAEPAELTKLTDDEKASSC